MKALRIIFFLFFFSFSLHLHAQFVNIPDSAFRGWMINHGLATCLTGTMLDTTCSGVATTTYIDCSSKQIRNLSGVEYFRNLDTLICAYNYVDTLAQLPSSVKYLACNSNPMHAFTSPLPNGLKYLNCSRSRIQIMPSLPDSVSELLCSHDSIVSFTNLPTQLFTFDCSYNRLTSLPTLPTGLNYFNCSENLLTLLPSLSGTLTDIQCAGNNLTILPTLPNSLLNLNCSYNFTLNTLPALPSTLLFLNCSYDDLNFLPNLPDSLKTLDCRVNYSLTVLPPLPSALIWLQCDADSLTILPSLPASLALLTCSNNHLSSLPTLPVSLATLYCDSNHITFQSNQFQSITTDLFRFSCQHNQITILPQLPTLLELDCSNNLLTDLFVDFNTAFEIGTRLNCSNNQLNLLSDLTFVQYVNCSDNRLNNLIYSFNSEINALDCSRNQITALPYFSNRVVNFNLSNNPIACLPPSPQTLTILNISNTNIHCIPNYSYSSLTGNLPLCQLSNPCPAYWNIKGSVFFDINGNCTQDTNDIFLKDIPVVLDSAGVQLQRFLTDDYGNYSFRTGLGSYTVYIDSSSSNFQVVCPSAQFYSSVLTIADSTDSLSGFGLQCKPGYDLAVNSISPSAMFRPGADRTLYLNAGDAFSFSGIQCNSTVGGSVQASFTGPLTYISPATGAIIPSSVVGNIITWNVPDFSLVNPANDFNIVVNVPSSATLQDTICIQMDVTPVAGDNIPGNNSLTSCFPVVGSFDPNEKYMSPSGVVDTSTHWFTFTIFFQNTGTAAAEMIYILDTLDAGLDPTTFAFLQSSHSVITQMLPGNILRFNFANIQLPDSSTNLEGSQGYVKFKIRRDNNLSFGTTLENTAYIYFDFNPAVATNTVSATIDNFVSTMEIPTPAYKLFPNPARDYITLSHVVQSPGKFVSISIYNTMGQTVQEYALPEKPSMQLDLTGLSQGIYILKIVGNGKSVILRIEKE